MTRLLCTLLLLGLPVLARAAEPVPPTEPAPAAPASASPSPTATTPETARNSASDEAAATRKANERFKPSEKISEDLSVSFPSDI